MVAIALSGFSFEKSLWRTQCITALSQIIDPHLRALFAFLTPDNDNAYDIVLVRLSRQKQRVRFYLNIDFICLEGIWHFIE